MIQCYVYITSERWMNGRLVSRVTVSNTVETPEKAFIWLCSQGRCDNGKIVDFGLKPVEVEDEQRDAVLP